MGRRFGGAVACCPSSLPMELSGTAAAASNAACSARRRSSSSRRMRSASATCCTATCHPSRTPGGANARPLARSSPTLERLHLGLRRKARGCVCVGSAGLGGGTPLPLLADEIDLDLLAHALQRAQRSGGDAEAVYAEATCLVAACVAWRARRSGRDVLSATCLPRVSSPARGGERTPGSSIPCACGGAPGQTPRSVAAGCRRSPSVRCRSRPRGALKEQRPAAMLSSARQPGGQRGSQEGGRVRARVWHWAVGRERSPSCPVVSSFSAASSSLCSFMALT